MSVKFFLKTLNSTIVTSIMTNAFAGTEGGNLNPRQTISKILMTQKDTAYFAKYIF